MEYEAVIGLEVHAELLTQSKMFCSCAVVDSTQAEPNVTVCPVCAGMPGVLPVVNRQAVEYAIRVGLALGCSIAPVSFFERKNYFYPDLPKGYQISQYERPLAANGQLIIQTSQGERCIRIRRAHLEEDTGKLTHVNRDGGAFSLVDLNRAGVPLLEIVSEPDMHTAEEVRAYGGELRSILRCLGVNSGDMEKGVIRFEANVSVRPAGSSELGTRVEIKNLNSFRAMERAIEYQVVQQVARIERGEAVEQETLGWDEANGVTYSQRSKEDAHDYRYFPEPDLPPLVVEDEWVQRVAAALPELPRQKMLRFQEQYGLSGYDASLLSAEQAAADFFEQTVQAAAGLPGRTVSNWLTGEVFAWLNQNGAAFEQLRVTPAGLADLLRRVAGGEINQNTAKSVLAEMLSGGQSAAEIVAAKGLRQISDADAIAGMIAKVLQDNPTEVESYRNGKETVAQWFFGQVMRLARGQANPQVVRAELEKQLNRLK